MVKPFDWDSRIGRRVRLRDLHILFAVVQYGSMAKAGVHLGMSQSAVSQAIAALERALGVRLLDRTSRGVEPTMYGSALLRRGLSAFDELRLGVKEIEFLADPAAGEVRIACPEAIAAGFLPPIIERLSRRYPRVTLQVFGVEIGAENYRMEFPELRERKADVRFTLLPRPLEGELAHELNAEVLCYDRICLAAGAQSPWARRRKIDLADLVDEPWILPFSDRPGARAVMEAFHMRGLAPPRVSVATQSVHLRTFLSMSGRFIVALPVSILRLHAELFFLKELRIELPLPPMPLAVVTLKNRTLSPTVELLVECARDVAKSMSKNR